MLTEGSYLRHRPTVVGDDEGLTVLHRSQNRGTVIAQLALADVLGCSGHAGNVARRSTLAFFHKQLLFTQTLWSLGDSNS